MQDNPVAPPLGPLPLNAQGVLKLVLVTLIGGIGPGTFLAAQSRLINLILLYPVIMTIGTGLIVAICIITYRIKNRPVVVLWTLAIGVLMYCSFRTTDYLLIVQKVSNQSGHSVSLSVPDYLSLKAKIGLTIASLGNSEGAITLSEPVLWGYWAAELLLICGGATMITMRGVAGTVDDRSPH